MAISVVGFSKLLYVVCSPGTPVIGRQVSPAEPVTQALNSAADIGPRCRRRACMLEGSSMYWKPPGRVRPSGIVVYCAARFGEAAMVVPSFASVFYFPCFIAWSAKRCRMVSQLLNLSTNPRSTTSSSPEWVLNWVTNTLFGEQAWPLHRN